MRREKNGRPFSWPVRDTERMFSEKSRRADASELEQVRIAQEEVALLGKEQIEAREVDLPVVDFRRGEIGVDGERAGERRRDAVVDVERRIARQRFGASA